MRILFLDDEIERQALYKFRHPDDDIIFVTNFKDALDTLRKNAPFDVADLDYQLNDVEIVDDKPHEKTGLHVAMFIATLPADRRPKRVVCHSLNGFRRMMMMKTLERAGIQALERPFE